MRKADPELHARRRSQIGHAAMSRFVIQGFHRTTVQEIAADADVSMGLLYRYFANKEAIVTEVAQQDRAATIARIQRFGAAAHFARPFQALLHDLLAAATEPGVLALTSEIAAEACRNEAVRAMVVQHERDIASALVTALERQASAGRIRPDVQLQSLATHALALVDGLAWRVGSTPKKDITGAVAWLVQRAGNELT